MMPLMSGVTGPSDSPSPTTHTRRFMPHPPADSSPTHPPIHSPPTRRFMAGRYLTPLSARMSARVCCSHAPRRSHPGQRRRSRGRAARRVREAPPREVPRHRAPGRAPRRRHRRVEVPRHPHPQRRAQRGDRPAARGIRHGPDQLRRAAQGHLRRERARARHVGQRPARFAQLPFAPRLRGAALRSARRQRRRARPQPRLQRLAHPRVVRVCA